MIFRKRITSHRVLFLNLGILLSGCQHYSATAEQTNAVSAAESDDETWKGHPALKKQFDELYNGEYATNPDDIPENEYEDNVADFYIGDLLIRDGQLYTERCGRGELLLITKNDRQQKLKEQLMAFVNKHEGVSVNVNIRGYIANNSDLVLVNYTALKPNKTCNFFKMLEQLNDTK